MNELEFIIMFFVTMTALTYTAMTTGYSYLLKKRIDKITMDAALKEKSLVELLRTQAKLNEKKVEKLELQIKKYEESGITEKQFNEIKDYKKLF